MASLDDAIPKVDPPNRRAAYLLTGLTLFTGLFTALGISSDDLSNVWRNHLLLSGISVTLVLVGVALGAIAGWILTAGRSERRALLAGNVLLGLGLILAAWAAMATATDRPQPTITAAPVQKKGQTLIRVQVENTNLRADQDLTVMVEPLFESEEGGALRYRVGRPLFSASIGPDGDGDVSRSILVNLPPGSFDDVGVRAFVDPASPCYNHESTTACHLVRLPKRTQEPRLKLRWKKGKAGKVSLLADISAYDIPGKSLQFLALSSGTGTRLLARASLSPNLHDDVQRRFSLPVAGGKRICVIASTKMLPLSCPPKDRHQAGWAMLRVPGTR